MKPDSPLYTMVKETAKQTMEQLLEEPYTLNVKETRAIRRLARAAYLEEMEELVVARVREKVVEDAERVANELMAELRQPKGDEHDPQEAEEDSV